MLPDQRHALQLKRKRKSGHTGSNSCRHTGWNRKKGGNKFSEKATTGINPAYIKRIAEGARNRSDFEVSRMETTMLESG
jgi:hypothetical protein